MSDRERTIFTAAESAFGAVLLIAGTLLIGGQVLIGALLIVFGSIAVGQAVLVGLGIAPTPGQPVTRKRKSE